MRGVRSPGDESPGTRRGEDLRDGTRRGEESGGSAHDRAAHRIAASEERCSPNDHEARSLAGDAAAETGGLAGSRGSESRGRDFSPPR